MSAECDAVRALVRAAWRGSEHTKKDWLRYLGRIKGLDAAEAATKEEAEEVRKQDDWDTWRAW